MYTTEAQFKEHGITATFKKRAPYPLTETQLSTPLPTVLELNGKRRYLSDIQLVKQELQSLIASRHTQKKIPATPNARPPVQSVVPFSRAASCGSHQETFSYGNTRHETKQDSRAFEGKSSLVSTSRALSQPFGGAMSLSTSYSSNAILCQGHTESRLGYRHYFDNSPLQVSNRCYDRLELGNIDTSFSQVDTCDPDPNDRPEVELGTFAGQAADNTGEPNEPATALSTQSFIGSTSTDGPAEADLHIGDLSTSCNRSTEESFAISSQNKIALSRITPLSRDTTAPCSAPLVVQSYLLPERHMLHSSSKGATIMPERNARVLKDVDLVDCWTMTTDADSSLATKNSLLISGVGSELVIGVTEQRLAPTVPHINARRPFNRLSKQEEPSRIVGKQQVEHLAEECCVPNASKQLSFNGDDITSRATEQHNVSSACVKQHLNLVTDTVKNELLASNIISEDSLESQSRPSNTVVESQAEPTKDSLSDELSNNVISNALALAPLVPLSNDIAIYRTGEDGTVFEEDLEDNRQLESKIGEEGSSYDDKDDAFLDSLNHMRRTYGIENAYNNFGAFLSNVSDFIRDCSVALPNEPLSSLSNDVMRRNPLPSTLQISDSPLSKNQSRLGTERFAQLRKSKNKKPTTTSALPPKEDIIEKFDTLPLAPLQDPASGTSVPADTMTQEDEVPSSTAPLVSVEQIQVLNLPQLRVVAFPNNAIKEEAVSLSHEEHTNLVEMSGEKPFLPPLELQPQLPSLTASTGASSPSYTITSGHQTSCMQPPNTPHVPEYLRISPPSTRGSSKGSQGLCNSLDLLSSNTSLPQALEAKPFTPRLPGFEEGSRNDAAISSAFETLKLIGYTSKGRGTSVSRSSYMQLRGRRASSTLQTSSFSVIEGPGAFSSATQRNTVNEVGVGCDPNRLILSRTALEDLMDMSDSDLSALRTNTLPANEARKGSVQHTGRRMVEPGMKYLLWQVPSTIN